MICDTFDVNNEWLRTGKGPVYIDPAGNSHTKLIALYEVLKPKYRNFILNSIHWFIKTQNEDGDDDFAAN